MRKRRDLAEVVEVEKAKLESEHAKSGNHLPERLAEADYPVENVANTTCTLF